MSDQADNDKITIDLDSLMYEIVNKVVEQNIYREKLVMAIDGKDSDVDNLNIINDFITYLNLININSFLTVEQINDINNRIFKQNQNVLDIIMNMITELQLMFNINGVDTPMLKKHIKSSLLRTRKYSVMPVEVLQTCTAYPPDLIKILANEINDDNYNYLVMLFYIRVYYRSL